MNGFKAKVGETLTKNEFVYSNEINLTVLILNTFEAREFTKLINENDDFKKIFKDVTYYSDI